MSLPLPTDYCGCVKPPPPDVILIIPPPPPPPKSFRAVRMTAACTTCHSAVRSVNSHINSRLFDVRESGGWSLLLVSACVGCLFISTAFLLISLRYRRWRWCGRDGSNRSNAAKSNISSRRPPSIPRTGTNHIVADTTVDRHPYIIRTCGGHNHYTAAKPQVKQPHYERLVTSTAPLVVKHQTTHAEIPTIRYVGVHDRSSGLCCDNQESDSHYYETLSPRFKCNTTAPPILVPKPAVKRTVKTPGTFLSPIV